jgi:hypothetical protein
MLWISQLIVFAVYPRFAIKHGRRALPWRQRPRALRAMDDAPSGGDMTAGVGATHKRAAPALPASG